MDETALSLLLPRKKMTGESSAEASGRVGRKERASGQGGAGVVHGVVPEGKAVGMQVNLHARELEERFLAGLPFLK